MRETFLQAVIGSGLESDSLSKTNIDKTARIRDKP